MKTNHIFSNLNSNHLIKVTMIIMQRHKLRRGDKNKTAKRSFSFAFAALVCLFALFTDAQAAPQINGQVNCYPNTVGAQSATLGMVLSMPVNVSGGSKITVVVPQSTSFEVGDSISCQLKGIVDVSTLCATSGPREISITLPENVRLFAGMLTALRFRDAFFAPLSTKTTDSFKVKITDVLGNLLAEDNGSMYITDLEPSNIRSATISQVNSVIVGAHTAVYFSVNTLNPIPSQGGVQIRFPKWNPKASVLSRESFLIDEFSFNIDGQTLPPKAGEEITDLAIDYNKLCSPKRGVSANIECNYYATSTYEYITLTKMFTETWEAGETFQFYIQRLRNPISQSAVPFELVTFESYQEIMEGLEPKIEGLVDRGEAMFIAETSAPIGMAEVRSEVTTVQEFSTFFITFKVPVPVQEGCIVTIQLPDAFTLDAGDLARVQGWGIFGRKSDLNFGIDESSRILKIVDQCAYYSGANTEASLEIEVLQNPFMARTTRSFFIQVSDENGQGIAEKAQGIFYTPTTGQISNVKLQSLGKTGIENVVDMRLEFTPAHAVAAGVNALRIKMPGQLPFSCTFASVDGLKTAPDCVLVNFNELRLINPFNDDQFAGKLGLTIVFKDRILPGANLMIKGIRIQTVMTLEDIDYVIDEIIDPEYKFFAPEQNLFLKSAVFTDSEEVYTDTVFHFKHTLANNVPADAIIMIWIPPQIEIGDAQKVLESCSNGLNMRDSFVCELLPITKDGEIQGHELWARGAFPEFGLSRNQEFELQVKSGLFTPLSVKTTETFQVTIYDSELHEINFVRRALSLTMKTGKDIGVVELIAGNGIVGGFTDHTLRFSAPAPLYSGCLIIVHIPEEVGAPMDQNFICTVASPLSQDLSGCRINGQRVTVTIAIEDSYGAERLKIGTPLEINLFPVQSPSSTKPTTPYQVEIKTELYQIVAEQHTRGPSVINTNPAVIMNPQIEALDLRQQATTTVTLTWMNTQVYPKDFALKLYVDTNEIIPIFDDPEVQEVPCVFRQTVIVTCEYLKDEPGVIRVTNLLSAEQNPGSALQLTLTRQQFSSVTPIITKSWQMETFTDGSTIYSIDRIDSGLTFSFECNLPCQTCLVEDRDFCLRCNQYQADYLILYNGKCNAVCPPETHMEAYQCLPCDSKCKTCAQTNGSTCTSCYGGFSQYPFLYGNTCVDECIFGFYGNRDTAECSTCFDPCETCTSNPDMCLSCKMPPAGIPIDKFFFEYQCLDACPTGWVANQDARSNVCELCSDNCASCEKSAMQCATCHAGMKLDLLTMTCVEDCTPLTTVMKYDQDRDQNVCMPCDSSCKTCSIEPTLCTSCWDNLSLSQGTCKLDCDEQNFSQVSIDGNCVGCSSSCATCQITQDNCLTCFPGKYFSATTCVDECPTWNGYKQVPNFEGVCHIPGLRCDFGYELNPTGDGCLLMAQVCTSPNKLNYDKDSCVPGSDVWVPFPLLFICIILIVIVLYIKKKKPESRFITNIIVFWGFVEFIGMWLIFGLAASFGIAPVVFMLAIALLFMVATNVFFFIVFQRQIMNDTTFFHWVNYNKKTVKYISIVALIFNFKAYRLLYSKFCGDERFNAPFENPYKFYTPLNLASFLNLLLTMLVSLIACFFTLYYVPWGYQLTVECAEFVIIEIAMIVFYIMEYCDMQNSGVLKRTPNWQADAKEVDRLKVKSGYDDELSDDDQDPDAYMIQEGPNKSRKDVKPKALKTIHTMERVLAQLLVKKNALDGGYEDTMKEMENLHERELMLRNRRRCMSFRIERPDFREAWGFESDEQDEGDLNYISEPGSPRSKEMLQNQNFSRRMQALSSTYHCRDQYDNVYAEARDPSVWPLTNATMVNKKLQTNVMELLGIGDLREDTQSESEDNLPSGIDFDYDPAQTAFLIDNVRDSIDDDERFYGTNDPLRNRRGSDPNAENYSSQQQTKPKRPKRQRKQLTKRRQAELPNFAVDEILGEFEPDQTGNAIILQTANGKLNDKFGRMVNRRGYLVDPAGNVITRSNVFIFYKEEIDFDDEIPAPYCFRKQKKNVKFSVRNFNQHRRMRRKDKAAMQDEFVEREYQKLKQAARKKKGGNAGDAQSQQYSQQEILAGVNASDRAHISSLRGHRQSGSTANGRGINNSGLPLLPQSESSHLGDVNLSNIILQDREGGDYFVPGNPDGLNRGEVQAQSASSFKRKPPRNPSTMSKQLQQPRKEDDQFIDQVTAPMRAKTKHELLGGASGMIVSDQPIQSARSNRSRSNSQSKSNPRYRVKDGKMLNISSQQSLERNMHDATLSDQQNSQTEIMAMPTAGGEPEDFEPTSQKPLQMSSSANLKAQQRSYMNTRNPSRPTSSDNPAGKHKSAKKQGVQTDEAFIKKVQEFNDFLQRRRQNDARMQSHDQLTGQAPQMPKAGTAGIIDDTFLNADGSIRNVGLAHKNLNQVYGRVRSKFNKQIRTGSHALKKRPIGSANRSNRVDDPSRIIAGMTYNQRERMLQLEINNMVGGRDDMSIASMQRRLFHQENELDHYSQAHSSPTPTQLRNRTNHNDKITALRSIYSDYRLNSASLRKGGVAALSPTHPINQVQYEASRVLNKTPKGQLVPGRQMDQELQCVQQRAIEVRSQIENISSGGGVITGNQTRTSNTMTTHGANRRTKSPSNLLDGKYL